MVTFNIPVGAIFGIGIGIGVVIGVVGLAVVAMIAVKSKNK